MSKNESSLEFADRLDRGGASSFLEKEEFDEVLGLLLGPGGWTGIIRRLKEKGFSEFKIGYSVGELKQIGEA
jgi:hypothetical protein